MPYIFFSPTVSSSMLAKPTSSLKTSASPSCSTQLQDNLIDMPYQLLKMYNSEEVYTFEENRQTESQPPSTDQQKNGRLNNSRPKNGLLSGQKVNGIFGTYARIVPKKPLHDMERLYAENMQLREKIRFLEEDCTKIKTRMSMAEKQKQQLIGQLCNLEYGNNVLRDRRPSQKGLIKTQQKPMKSSTFDENRRILHGYKDEISKLKLENGRLKKTVKYTQIQQLQTENQLLHEEMARLKKYMQDVIENTEYDEYEREIEVLNKQLQEEKDSKKSIMMQIKKKDQEMEDVKNKMKIIANRKTELEKKFNREITNVKGELHRVKEREKEYFVTGTEKKEVSKPKTAQKVAQCKKCSSFKESLDGERNRTKELEAKLNAKEKEISELQKKLKQLESKGAKSQQASPVKSNGKHEQKQKSINANKSEVKDQKQIPSKSPKQEQKPKKPGQPQPIPKKTEQKQEQSYNDEYDEDSDEDVHGQQKSNNVDQSSDKVDVFHVNLADQKEKEHPKNSEERYEDSFEESHKKKIGDQSEEEVLFKKEDKKEKGKKKKSQPEAPKEKNREKEKEKQMAKSKEKEKEGQKGLTKAQKILKETIKYRLMAQRYSYPDFHRDIKESGAKEFTIEELIQMLTNQPFFLTEQHLKMVLFSIFEKEELDESDSTSTGTFLKKMKNFIGEFQIRDEAEEQKLLKSIQSKLSKKKVLGKMKEEAINEAEISKKSFVKILKESAGLTDGEIEQCLAEASVLSVDIAHINYPQFLQKLGHS